MEELCWLTKFNSLHDTACPTSNNNLKDNLYRSGNRHKRVSETVQEWKREIESDGDDAMRPV